MTADPGVVSALLHAARSALNDHQIAVSGTDPRVIRLPSDADMELVRALTQTAKRLFQIVPWRATDKRSPRLLPRRARERDLNRESFLLSAWRAHAESGAIDVQRVYIVPYGDPDTEAAAESGVTTGSPTELDKTIDTDRQHKISTKHLYLSAHDDEDPPVPMINHWLVDDAVVVYEEYGDTGEPTWVVSAREEDVDTARHRWKDLWERRTDSPRRTSNAPEPLLASARLIADLASVHCQGDHVDETSCLWYHRAWQYLRLYNMVSSPNWHAEFYKTRLELELRRHKAPRVLITGTADYAMLAQVLAADHRRQAEIHVADLCPTPLLASRWYADRYHDHYGNTVHVHEWDFLNDTAKAAELGPFHVIVTDAFLTRFSREDADRIIANWSRILVPNGAVITTVRLPGTGASERSDSEYEDKLYRRAKYSHWMLDIELSSLRAAARHYFQNMKSQPLGTPNQIVKRFADHGLRRVHMERAETPGELGLTDYLRIVCYSRPLPP